MELDVPRRVPATRDSVSPLLLVHGACHGSWCWDHWASWFALRGREVHALNLRGHGASSGHESLDAFGLIDYRDDVLDMAATLARPIMVGHSMGGAVAQLAIAAAPSVFAGLVLLASPPPDGVRMLELLPLFLQVRGMLSLRKLWLGRKLTVAELQALPFFDGRLSGQDAARAGECLQRESKKASRQARTFRAPAFAGALPVLVLGSARDRLLAVSALRRTALHYSADLIVMESLCHDLMLDRHWEEAAGSLDGWLSAHQL